MQHTTITDEAAYGLWRLEYQLVDQDLRRVEDAERQLLTSLRCPTDPIAIVQILEGKTPAPWPRRTAARDRTRALHAMHVIIQIAAVRRSIALGQENARLAARAALLAGLHANSIEAALGRTVRRNNQIRARKRGVRQREDVIKRDAQIQTLAVQYRRQYPMRSTREMAANIARKVHRPVPTVRSVLKRLGLK